MKNQLFLTPKHIQKIYPKAIQGLNILSLPITEIDEYLNNIALENPLLELEFHKENLNDWTDRDASKGMIDTDFRSIKNHKKRNEIMDALAQGEGYLGNVPDSETLHGFLRLQLKLSTFSNVESRIGEEIIENINDDGYFVGELQEITYYHGQDLSIGQKMLKQIQTFSPAGVGASSIEECLVLQIDSETPNYTTMISLIQNDLEDLAYQRLTKLSRKYHISKTQVKEILCYIRTLNTRPGNQFEQMSNTCYVTPDIFVEKNESQYKIYVNNKTKYEISINQKYLKMLKDNGIRNDDKKYISGKYNQAIDVMKSLEMRHETLENLSILIFKEQYSFFEQGPRELKPLKMQEIAEIMSVHVSTISRAVQGKFIQTPWGMFPLKYFFNSSFVNKRSGVNVSAIQIKKRIEEMINKEDNECPLSDREIAEQLMGEGLVISRRTVAKYRQTLGINGQNKRKCLLKMSIS